MTGGLDFSGSIHKGQLRIWTWDGTTLTLKKSEEWYTADSTYRDSVFVADVDGDGENEIVTGGGAYDGSRDNGQLRIWGLGTLSVGGEVFPIDRLAMLTPYVAALSPSHSRKTRRNPSANSVGKGKKYPHSINWLSRAGHGCGHE